MQPAVAAETSLGGKEELEGNRQLFHNLHGRSRGWEGETSDQKTPTWRTGLTKIDLCLTTAAAKERRGIRDLSRGMDQGLEQDSVGVLAPQCPELWGQMRQGLVEEEPMSR